MMSAASGLFAGLGCVQFRIRPARPEENLRQVAAALDAAGDLSRTLIVLPELWASGFAYDRLGEMADASAAMLDGLARLAGRHRCIIAGSLLEDRSGGGDGRFYNTLHVSGAGGVIGSYRKQQIFLHGGEGQAFEPGFEPYPVETPLGVIGCLVCYDLRFPELARSQSQQGADLLICAAEWPLERIGHWRSLLTARAVENQTFVVGCNGWGEVGGVELGGGSAIIDPLGNVLAAAADGPEPQAVVVRADWQLREEYRSRFRSFAVSAYRFRDERKIVATAASCLELLARRKKAGQRLVRCEVAGEVTDLPDLEEARRAGDFLVVVLCQPDPDGREGRRLAALGCVDAVCRLEDFSAGERRTLADLAPLAGRVR
jgi:predicted amidohydrolase